MRARAYPARRRPPRAPRAQTRRVPDPRFAREDQALLLQAACRGEVTLLQRELAEIVQRDCDALSIAQCCVRSQALFVVSARGVRIALRVGDGAEAGLRIGGSTGIPKLLECPVRVLKVHAGRRMVATRAGQAPEAGRSGRLGRAVVVRPAHGECLRE